MKNLILTLSGFLVGLVISCSVSKTAELDKSVKVFLSEFQHKLMYEDEVWTLFKTSQSKEDVLKALTILRGRDTSLLIVTTRYDEAASSWKDSYLVVEIPVEMTGRGEPFEKVTFSLLLTRKDGRYYINRIDGENLYRRFSIVRSNIINSGEMAERARNYKMYYEQSKQLQGDYDSMAWFVSHNGMTYYYTIKSDSNNSGKFYMGLLDNNGKVIVPAKFDLIGTPSMGLQEAVEVRIGNSVGYYSLNGTEIVPVVYDWLISYKEGETQALVMRDSLYGWLDRQFAFHAEFPSQRAEEAIKGFSYLTENKFALGAAHQDLIIPLIPWSEEIIHAGLGIIVPPAYLVKTGVLDKVESGYISTYETTNERVYQFGTAYIENTNRKPMTISETIRAFISDFSGRFIGSREQFYVNHKITLLDRNSKILGALKTEGDKDFTLRKVDANLLETRFNYVRWEPEFDLFEQNFPGYNYLRIEEGKLIELESRRRFKFTQFVKMDSSYLSGNFVTYDWSHPPSDTTRGKATFASVATLNSMRDEILADYGFIFEDSATVEHFKNWQWYKPTTRDYEEVYARASDIEKLNLDFLAKLIGPPLRRKPT